MNRAENTVGIGPWSLDAGPFAVVVLIVVVAVVMYYVRKD